MTTETLTDLLNSATGRSLSSEVKNPVSGMIETAPASIMTKDLRLATSAASEAGAKLMLARSAKEVYDKTGKAHTGRDLSVVYRWLGGKELILLYSKYLHSRLFCFVKMRSGDTPGALVVRVKVPRSQSLSPPFHHHE